PPIDLTGEANDSAVFPWMVAGSPGQVDLVLYKANSGLNPNIAFYDANGNPCTEGDPGCNPNTTVWNTYFGQSQNALNTGANFEPKPRPSMDVLGTSAPRSGDLLTVSMTLAAPPAAPAAITCATPAVATGGVWGAEFWTASNPVGNTAIYNNDNFYIAYRDNPPDGAPRVEAGAINSISPTFTHDEFNPYERGTLGGNCTGPLPPSPCTL